MLRILQHGGTMLHTLDEMRINSTEIADLERCLSTRNALVEQALATQDYELLQSISAMDKCNLQFLENAEKKLSNELANFTKLKAYLE